jgi:hypothetical protein
MILALDWVPKPGAEAQVAVGCLDRLGPRLPGAQGVIYDGALRGKHLEHLLHDLGLLGVCPVTAASGGRRAKRSRTERQVFVEAAEVTRADKTCTIQLYSRGGRLCVGELDEKGEVVLVELTRKKILRRTNADGTYRWYGEFEVPESSGGGTVRVRLDLTDEDRKRGFNRTEHLRPIPPGDDDYRRLYPRRPDIESINRALDDSLWLKRAHSVGHARQLVDLMGYVLRLNSIALHRHRRTRAPVRAEAA